MAKLHFLLSLDLEKVKVVGNGMGVLRVGLISFRIPIPPSSIIDKKEGPFNNSEQFFY